MADTKTNKPLPKGRMGVAAQRDKRIKVTLVGSPIGQTQRQRQTLRGLGLTRLGKTVVVRCDEPTLGMIEKVHHLVRVEA